MQIPGPSHQTIKSLSGRGGPRNLNLTCPPSDSEALWILKTIALKHLLLSLLCGIPC